jgi:hypothetical protein
MRFSDPLTASAGGPIGGAGRSRDAIRGVQAHFVAHRAAGEVPAAAAGSADGFVNCWQIIGGGCSSLAEVKKGSTMTHAADPRVDAYIDALPGWQQAICREIRDLVHAADPAVSETIKRTNQPYFVLQGNVCAVLAAKDHVNVFLYDGAIVPDPDEIITGGHGNKTARTVAIRQGETINAAALTAMFKHIIANNRAGGWRRLKNQS